MATNSILIVVALALVCVLFHPRVLGARAWRATVTPLASIIGSGFLVAGPILADTAGRWAWLAMLGLCVVGYLYGSAMRANIRWIEPRYDALSPTARRLERLSQPVLALAYFVSVTYYLNLFAAFGLRLLGVQDPFLIKALATAAIVVVGAIGVSGGLSALERLEVLAVGLKLAVIGGLLCSLGAAAAAAMAHHTPPPHLDHRAGFEGPRILLGLIILVQGFETSRFLGEAYDGDTRIRTMRFAQWISTAIYVLFVFLVTRLFSDGLPGEGGETAIIDMLRPLGSAVAPMLVVAALASQSSAAIADMNGAGGLIAEASGGRVAVRWANLLVAGVAVAITWAGGIYQIITWASKAFVAYYGLQSLQALLAARTARAPAQVALYALGVILALAVIVLAKPAAA